MSANDRTGANQRAFIREIADKIEAGEELPPPDKHFARAFIAAVLRGAADSIPDTPKRGAGNAKARKVDALLVAMTYYGENKTQENLADQYGVSVTTVKAAIKKAGPTAKKLLSLPRARVIPKRVARNSRK